MPDIPKGHKVIDTVKDNKGFYRIIERPDGTKYSQTLKLFTEQDNDRKVRAENKSLGQFSTTNIKGNMANAMALTAVGGGAAALALHNATHGRQDKVGRKFRGAAFGSTRPQGAGLKTPAGTAGDVRGRISTDRPPAIVRSVESFTKTAKPTTPTRGVAVNRNPLSASEKAAVESAMQQRKGLRGQSSPLQNKGTETMAERPPIQPGRRIIGGATSSSSGSGSTSSVKQRPKPGTPTGRIKIAAKYLDGFGARELRLRSGSGFMAPQGPSGSVVDQSKGRTVEPYTPKYRDRNGNPINPRVTPSTRPGLKSGEGMQPRPGGRSPGVAVNRNPLTAAEKQAIAKARTARRSSTPTPPSTPVRPPYRAGADGAAEAAARNSAYPSRTSGPTPQFGPTPTGTRPYVPPGQSAVPTFKTPAPMPTQFSQMPKAGGGPTANVPSRLTQSIPKKVGFLGKYGRTAGKIGSVIATAVGASELYDQLAPKNAPRAPWMSGGDKKAPASQTPAATAPSPGASGGNKPSGGQKPYEPRYFPEAGGNGNAVRKPDSYLGEAFDYSLQKGTTSGSKYLEHMFRRDKVSEDDQQRLRERFNKKVVGDQTLQEYGADKGITETVEGKTPGLGKALLEKYRDTGTYRGNTDYGKMRAAAETRMARK